MKSVDFYSLNNDWLQLTFSNLIDNGDQLKSMIKSEMAYKLTTSNDGVIQIPLHLAKHGVQKTTSKSQLELIRVVNDLGTDQYFTFLVELRNDKSSLSSKVSQNILEDETDLFLAWDYEQFFSEEDENNNIIYPITFEATSLKDASVKALVTVDEDQHLTWQFKSETVAKMKTANTPQLVTIEAISIEEIEPVPTGTHAPIGGTHLIITSMKIATTGDGTGSSELQLFMDANDDYSLTTSKSLDFFFDTKYTLTDGPTNQNKGSDGRYYQVPDVNSKNFTYSFNGIPGGSLYSESSSNSNYWQLMPGFPILQLNEVPNRFFLSDEDGEGYSKFSLRRSTLYIFDISTWDASNGTSSMLTHRIGGESFTYGSSDDVIIGGAARRLNYNTMFFGVSNPKTMTSAGTEIEFGNLFW